MGYLDRLRALLGADGADAETTPDADGADMSEGRSPLELELIGRLQRALADPASAQAPVRLALRFRGRVQGVGFRWSNQGTAQELGLTGWVRNNPDGSVSMELQGAPGRIIRHLDAIHARYRRMGCRVWLDSVRELAPHADEDDFSVSY